MKAATGCSDRVMVGDGLAPASERGLAGGAVMADVADGNVITGAVIGGPAGVFPEDLGACW